MTRMMVLTALAFGVTTASALLAEAPPQAGFDCARAESPLEKAICADEETAEADRAMSVAYRALLAPGADPTFIAALQADQRSFLAIRQQAWEVTSNRQMAKERLRDETDFRAERLNWITPAPQAGLLGTWGNAWGLIKVSKAGDGRLQVSANVVDQIAGTWLCGYEGALLEVGAAKAEGHTLTETLLISRQGPLLQVENDFCDETGPAINGSMKGVYFKIGAEAD